jgi:NADH-quinone oxidoreductase subunit M
MSGFVGEFLSLVGTFPRHPWMTGLSLLGIVVAAAYTLTAVQKILLGPLNEKWKAMPDITVHELVTVVPLLLVILALGFYPLFLLRLQDHTIVTLLRHLRF